MVRTALIATLTLLMSACSNVEWIEYDNAVNTSLSEQEYHRILREHFYVGQDLDEAIDVGYSLGLWWTQQLRRMDLSNYDPESLDGPRTYLFDEPDGSRSLAAIVRHRRYPQPKGLMTITMPPPWWLVFRFDDGDRLVSVTEDRTSHKYDNQGKRVPIIHDARVIPPEEDRSHDDLDPSP